MQQVKQCHLNGNYRSILCLVCTIGIVIYIYLRFSFMKTCLPFSDIDKYAIQMGKIVVEVRIYVAVRPFVTPHLFLQHVCHFLKVGRTCNCSYKICFLDLSF